MDVPYNIPGINRVVALINSDNNTNFRVDSFWFGEPEIYFGNRNTYVKTIPRQGSGLSGNRVFYYNRLDFSTFFGGPVVIDGAGIETTWDIAVALNQYYDLAITEDDIILERVIGTHHYLKSKTGSYAWIGNVDVRLSNDTAELATILRINLMEGLTYPDTNL